MLDFFRRHQRYFFLLITVVVIASFTFYGTYSAFAGEEVEKKDRRIGSKIDGSSMMLSEVQRLSRFIATDREDTFHGKGSLPNFCNDGVIRYDFLKSRLADLLVGEYFDVLEKDLAARFEKAKRYRPYAHPEAQFLSAKAVWDQLLPALSAEMVALQTEEKMSPEVFAHLERLYQFQSDLQPEMLRRILIYQHQQYPWLSIDPSLSHEDLALFGFHSASDWFGRDFVDLIAQFILNAAALAVEKGYEVSLEEAQGDLIHCFGESIQKFSKGKTEANFHQHLHLLGFDEKTASEVWRKVLLFRKYFNDIGGAAFVDRLPFKDFAQYAHETAVVQTYQWPIRIQNGRDLAELDFYLKAVCPPFKKLPSSLLSVEVVEKNHPELVETTYRAQVAESSKKEVGLKASLKEVLQWQLDEKNWAKLQKTFSLSAGNSKEDRLKILQSLDLKKRAAVDTFARATLVDQNPAWIEEALASAPLREKSWAVSGREDPLSKKEGIYTRVEQLEKVEGPKILTFAKARPFLKEKVASVKEEYAAEKNLFVQVSREALAAVQKKPTDPAWVQSGTDPLLDQFKLERKEISLQRTSQESWMKEQAFMLLPDAWSPIHLAEDGQVVFFYLQEKKVHEAPILDQLSLGKETLSADAKAYVTEKLLQTVKNKKAIVIPVQREEE